MIDILHMTPWPLGGATSYVVHLARTLALAGVPARVLRPAKRTEAKKRQIGEYGVYYQNVSWSDLSRSKGVPLLASAPVDQAEAKEVARHVLMNDGKFVFHDPNEFNQYPHWGYAGARDQTICIRETGLKHVNGVFIPHPYVRTSDDKVRPRLVHAVSIARTSAVKRSDWILEANQTLPPQLQVRLYGEVNRMWWNFNVKKKFPGIELPPDAHYPRRWGAGVALCMNATYMVDLTIFKNDGGGTQYSFLEAMDAGAVPVMSYDWITYPGPAKDFGFFVSDATALRDFLLRSTSDKTVKTMTATLRRANYNYLARVHNPSVIGRAYAKELGVSVNDSVEC